MELGTKPSIAQAGAEDKRSNEMNATQFKSTMWTELDAESIQVIAKCIIKSTGHIETIQLN